jgi:hypothetical protein
VSRLVNAGVRAVVRGRGGNASCAGIVVLGALAFYVAAVLHGRGVSWWAMAAVVVLVALALAYRGAK